MLKEILPIIVTLLKWLTNECFGEGVFMSGTKIMKVIPKYKIGKRNEAENFRPISILPDLSEFLEILLENRFVSFFF